MRTFLDWIGLGLAADFRPVLNVGARVAELLWSEGVCACRIVHESNGVTIVELPNDVRLGLVARRVRRWWMRRHGLAFATWRHSRDTCNRPVVPGDAWRYRAMTKLVAPRVNAFTSARLQ